MKQLFYVLILLTTIVACNEIKEPDVDNRITGQGIETFQPTFIKFEPIIDTLSVISDNVCLSFDLDSLNSSDGYYDIQIIDVANSKVLLPWSALMGRLFINKIADGKYEFIGKTHLPTNGNWEQKFQKNDFIKYTLEIDKKGYRFFRNKEVAVHLKYSEKKIETLKVAIFSNKDCLSDDWDIANDCFDLIRQYEFQLFAALLDGNLKYKKDYLSLRDDISIVNAGQFSEYLAGNMFMLGFYDIIKISEYNFDRIYKDEEIEEGKKHCF
jgi:hypothetical protein